MKRWIAIIGLFLMTGCAEGGQQCLSEQQEQWHVICENIKCPLVVIAEYEERKEDRRVTIVVSGASEADILFMQRRIVGMLLKDRIIPVVSEQLIMKDETETIDELLEFRSNARVIVTK